MSAGGHQRLLNQELVAIGIRILHLAPDDVREFGDLVIVASVHQRHLDQMRAGRIGAAVALQRQPDMQMIQAIAVGGMLQRTDLRRPLGAADDEPAVLHAIHLADAGAHGDGRAGVGQHGEAIVLAAVVTGAGVEGDDIGGTSHHGDDQVDEVPAEDVHGAALELSDPTAVVIAVPAAHHRMELEDFAEPPLAQGVLDEADGGIVAVHVAQLDGQPTALHLVQQRAELRQRRPAGLVQVHMQTMVGAAMGRRHQLQAVRLHRDHLQPRNRKQLVLRHPAQSLILLQAMTALIPDGIRLDHAHHLVQLRQTPQRRHLLRPVIVPNANLTDLDLPEHLSA